jgi:hypothetical protein
VSDAGHRGEDVFAEARLPQVVRRDGGVLDHVMQDGHDLGLLSLNGHHHPKGCRP